MRLLHCILMMGLLLFGAAQAPAAATHIHAALLAESGTPAPGSRVTIALAMTPDPGWHGYWQNPGDAGVEMRVNWALPPGATVSPLSYPVPQRLIIAGLMNYVYEGPYAHLGTLTIPADLKPGARLPIRLEAEWLACTDQICVPERDTLAIGLVVGDGTIAPAERVRFDEWRAALPKPLGSTSHVAIENGKVRVAVPFPKTMAVVDPYFYPLTKNAVAYAAPQQISRNGDDLIIEAAPGASPASMLDGVLAIGPDNGLFVHAVPGQVPQAGEPIGANGSAAAKPAIGTVLASFGAALLGGLLLNIMPCVFPILSLKAMSLVRTGEDERDARREALAYAAGVILVCLLLGATLLGLRAGGAALGWAFQLQDPRVILILMLLVGAIGFNLAGLFELPILAAGEGLARSGGVAGAFWTGALAAFIATPCTGPFMAGALGAALVLPVAPAMAIFFGLGFGLALPFLLLGFVPPLRRILPRPGRWMGTFRRILSLPMFLTAIGLAWILGRQAGANAMTLGLAALLLLIAGLWWTGRRQASGKRAAWTPSLAAVAVALAATLAIPKPSAQVMAEPASHEAEPFDEAQLISLRNQGRSVFLYFTADWCLTCKVNEKAAIERGEVKSAFRTAGIVTMMGDWTRGDPAISRFLAEHGRSGVPLYLFYPAGGAEPRELPQILTPAMLKALPQLNGHG